METVETRLALLEKEATEAKERAEKEAAKQQAVIDSIDKA